MTAVPTFPAIGAGVGQNIRARLRWMECARALAVLGIVIFHADKSVAGAGGPAFAWMGLLDHGIGFLFVLSGFAIMSAHGGDIGRPATIGHYARARAIRLLPALWLVVLVCLSARFWAGDGIDADLLIRSLIPYPSPQMPAPPAAWILRHAVLFYLAFAAMLLSGRAGTILFGVWAVAVLMQMALSLAGTPVTGSASFFLSAFALDFMLGMALARLHRGRRFRPVIWPLAAGLALLAAYLPFAGAIGLNRLNTLDYISPGATLGVLIPGLIFALVLHGVLRLGRIWQAPRMLVSLGMASYAIYLVHTPVNSLVHRVIGELPDIVRAWGGGQFLLIVAGVAVGLVLHFSFEKPALRFLRSRISGSADGGPEPVRKIRQELGLLPDRYAKKPDGGSVSWFSRMFRRRPEEISEEDFQPELLEIDVENAADIGPGGHAMPEAAAHPGFPRKRSAHSLPRFSAGGSDRGVPVAQMERMRKLRAAFTPSHPISDTSLFAGRRGLLLRLIQLIEDQKLHVVLYGDRGIGKTSVLRVLSSLAREAHYNVMYASCGSDTDFDSLFRSVAREIPLLFHEDYEPTSEEVESGGVFADLLPDRAVTVADVTTLFEALRGTQLLVIIDEFDRVESNRMREQVAELIKNLSDRGAPVQCLIAGVASNLTALVSHIPSIRRNLIGLPIGPLGDEEIREVLNNAAERSGVSFSDDAAEMMMRFSTGLPYLAQLLGLHASLLAVRGEQDVVSDSDVLIAVGHSVDEIRLRISPRGVRVTEAAAEQIGWDRLGELARRALLQVGVLSDDDVAELDSRSKKELLVQSSEEETTRWSFAEEAVVPYVWLNARLAESTPARFAASQTFKKLEKAAQGFGPGDE